MQSKLEKLAKQEKKGQELTPEEQKEERDAQITFEAYAGLMDDF